MRVTTCGGSIVVILFIVIYDWSWPKQNGNKIKKMAKNGGWLGKI